ncbi:hypothetical protein GA076_24420 [Vibrio parahaemolyticus]|uniref:hypothetical protein n=1 Tax=Vibrio mimicus TaxID=674 RepID=UPI0001BACC63|nr:hypothetical protein [Vibrio mimicus]EGU9031358.1 hypothetical protein [Vibrio parahaemolyticus]EJL7832858.1 hypothetical protein [Vibrio vulnificus]EEY45380.1 hypothetical protein VMA_000775 [Vibrio mimicus VM223]EIO4610142.1 hypothetical protein [Vibrio parahaemolyticus]EJE4163758.1 hypothetical protein [Vibrio parahaemolyticus]
MKEEKKGSLQWIVASSIFLVLVISSIPALIYFSHFSGKFSDDSSKWADFGSYMSGTSGSLLSVFSVLALVYTLYKTSKDSRITHELSLKAIEKSEQQVKLMDREFKTNLLRVYISNLNSDLEKKKYYDYQGNEISSQEFVNGCYRYLGNLIWSRMSNNIPENKRGFDFYVPSTILSERKTSFRGEVKNLFYILDLIDRCEDEELKVLLIKTYHSDIDQDLLFWMTCYCYAQRPDIKKILDRNMQSLLFLTDKACDEITKGTDSANNNQACPNQ